MSSRRSLLGEWWGGQVRDYAVFPRWAREDGPGRQSRPAPRGRGSGRRRRIGIRPPAGGLAGEATMAPSVPRVRRGRGVDRGMRHVNGVDVGHPLMDPTSRAWTWGGSRDTPRPRRARGTDGGRLRHLLLAPTRCAPAGNLVTGLCASCPPSFEDHIPALHSLIGALHLPTPALHSPIEALHLPTPALHPTIGALHPTIEALHLPIEALHPAIEALHPAIEALHLAIVWEHHAPSRAAVVRATPQSWCSTSGPSIAHQGCRRVS
jgi:hypothetical protein